MYLFLTNTLIMARIKFSALVSDVRGKIGGNIFSRNRGGAYVRTHVKSINPNTNAQQVIRNRMAALVQQWRSFTDSERLSWKNVSQLFPQTNKLGEVFFLTGQQLFTKFGSNKKAIGQFSTPDAPQPSTESPIEFDGFFPEFENSTLSVNVVTLPANVSLILRATDGLSAGRSQAYRSQYRQLGIAPVVAASMIPFDAAWTAVFGTMAPKTGLKIFLELLTVDKSTGQVVGTVRTSAVIA